MRIFRALGQETRLEILSLLSKGSLSVQELGSVLEVSQPAVSQHLKVLKDVGLVRLSKKGKLTMCSIDESVLEAVRMRIASFLEGSAERRSVLDELVRKVRARARELRHRHPGLEEVIRKIADRGSDPSRNGCRDVDC